MGSSNKALLLALLLAQQANKRNMVPGPQGDTITGDRGPQGERGADGINGRDGADGERGLTGDRGPQGERGLTGDRGPQGERGLQGERGADGVDGATGQRGQRGARGERGLTGERGPQGERGTDGAAGKPGIVWRGDWLATTQYATDDAVQAGGSSWIAKRKTKGEYPPMYREDWDLLAAKGQDGIGPSGGTLAVIGPIEISPGATATIDIGETNAATWRLSYNVGANQYLETVQANGDTDYTVYAKLGGVVARGLSITLAGGLLLQVTNNEATAMTVRATRF